MRRVKSPTMSETYVQAPLLNLIAWAIQQWDAGNLSAAEAMQHIHNGIDECPMKERTTMTPEFKAFVEAMKLQAENSLTILRTGTAEYGYYAGRNDICDALLLSDDIGHVCDVPEWPVGLKEMMARQNNLLDRLRKMESRKKGAS